MQAVMQKRHAHLLRFDRPLCEGSCRHPAQLSTDKSGPRSHRTPIIPGDSESPKQIHPHSKDPTQGPTRPPQPEPAHPTSPHTSSAKCLSQCATQPPVFTSNRWPTHTQQLHCTAGQGTPAPAPRQYSGSTRHYSGGKVAAVFARQHCSVLICPSCLPCLWCPTRGGKAANLLGGAAADVAPLVAGAAQAVVDVTPAHTVCGGGAAAAAGRQVQTCV